MKKEVGWWMDHRKAVIVVITDKAEEMKVIISKVEKTAPPFGWFTSQGSA